MYADITMLYLTILTYQQIDITLLSYKTNQRKIPENYLLLGLTATLTKSPISAVIQVDLSLSIPIMNSCND